MSAWFHGGEGLKLWEETYAPFNLIPRPGGSTGAQMGGWFNKKINSIEDFKGLKMRIPGLGGKVLAKAGATVVLTAGGEIFTNLERGAIDATEWVGPLHDNRMGFYQAAKYYYYPGWHDPGTYLEYFFNKQAYSPARKRPWKTWPGTLVRLWRIIRASFSQERMIYIPEKSEVVYQSKEGKKQKIFDALEWIAAMCSHVPNKGEQMVYLYVDPVYPDTFTT